MNVLVTAATALELNPLKDRLAAQALPNGLSILFLETGIGTVATTYALSKQLQQAHYNLALNVGIAGSFGSKPAIGDVCLVEQETFAGLGVQSTGRLTTIFEEGLVSGNSFPFENGVLKCPYTNRLGLETLPRVHAITSDTISGDADRAKLLTAKFNPDIESMEGAAFFYVCLQKRIPFIELRAISNRVGERDKAKWNSSLALENLIYTTEKFLTGLRSF